MIAERRRFIAKASGMVAAAAAAAIVDAPNVIAQPKVQWRMSTAYPPALDMQPGRGPATGEGRRGDERRAVPDRGLPGRPDHAAVRRASTPPRRAPSRRFMAGPIYWADEGAGDPVVLDRPVRHEPRGHGGLVLPGRRAQALGGDVRRLQPRPAPWPGRTAPRWGDGSGRRSTRSATTRGSRCASRASAARSWPGRGRRSS